MLFKNPARLTATRGFIEDFTLKNYGKDQTAYEARKAADDPDYLKYLVRNVRLH